LFIQPESTNKPPAYPTSAKKKTDWNEIEKPVAEEQLEGDAALNAAYVWKGLNFFGKGSGIIKD